MEFGKKIHDQIDPLAERRQNMKPSEYFNWRLENGGYSEEDRGKITKEKLRITNEIVSKTSHSLTFNNEMIDILLDGGVTEDVINKWEEQSLVDEPPEDPPFKPDDFQQDETQINDHQDEKSSEVGENGLPLPKNVGIPKWQEGDLV